MKYEELKTQIDNGLNIKQLQEYFGITENPMIYWLKKYNLSIPGRKIRKRNHTKLENIDWNAIKKDKDSGLSIQEIKEKYNITGRNWATAKKLKLIPFVTKTLTYKGKRKTKKINEIDWNVIQLDHDENKINGEEIMRKYNISSNVFKTKETKI